MNWKMNPLSLKQAIKLAKTSDKKNVVLCPPFVFLSEVKKSIKNAELGAQNSFWENPPIGGGAFTGEISPLILKEMGCRYVIIGHSERRKHLRETDEMVNKKIKSALVVGLKPILCVGSKKKDKLAEREIKIQLKN